MQQKEVGTCFGRGFGDEDVDGLMAKFKTWIIKAPTSGGPGWYILKEYDDETQHYLVVSDTMCVSAHEYDTNPNSEEPMVIKIGYTKSESGFIRMIVYGGFDSSNDVEYGIIRNVRINTTDAGAFSYRFSVSDNVFLFSTKLSGSTSSGSVSRFDLDLNYNHSWNMKGTLASANYGSVGDTTILQLQAGQAALFADAYPHVNYKDLFLYNPYADVTGAYYRRYYVRCKLTNVDEINDTITIQALSDFSTTYDGTYGYRKFTDGLFVSGCMISPMPRRFIINGARYDGNGSIGGGSPAFSYISDGGYLDWMPNGMGLSYVAYNRVLSKSSSYINEPLFVGRFDYSSNVTFGNSPDYHVYGVARDMMFTQINGRTELENGIVVNSANYLYVGSYINDGTYGIYFLDKVEA